jgi:hypothetical protein
MDSLNDLGITLPSSITYIASAIGFFTSSIRILNTLFCISSSPGTLFLGRFLSIRSITSSVTSGSALSGVRSAYGRECSGFSPRSLRSASFSPGKNFSARIRAISLKPWLLRPVVGSIRGGICGSWCPPFLLYLDILYSPLLCLIAGLLVTSSRNTL